MASGIFTMRTRWYFNTPYMIRRLGKWRNDILAETGAYARGVFRNKLGRPQKKQTTERTVTITMQLTDSRGRNYPYSETLFVPREGPIVEVATRRLAPRMAAQRALAIVAARVKGQGAGKPPRMGSTKKLRRWNDFQLDPKTESVVAGTVPLPKRARIAAASVPHLLDQMEPGARGEEISHPVMDQSVFAVYAQHPYVESTLGPTVNKAKSIIRRHPVGA